MPVSLEEYFRTTFEDKLLVKLPEREDEHLTPATRLLEKRREMTEVEQVIIKCIRLNYKGAGSGVQLEDPAPSY